MDRSGAVFPDQSSYSFSTDKVHGFSIFLEQRCKRIYFIRHAEGIHNEAERHSHTNPKSHILLKEHSGMKFWDAPLTEEGKRQCTKLKGTVRGDSVWARPHPLNFQLVVVSPLTRTLQTAFLSLGDASSPGAPPFIATELCRERIADFTCDGRRNISILKKEFPGVDFSDIKSDEDEMFSQQKEDDELCKKRGLRFLEWLNSRPETRIAVVTHSVFLKNLFGQYGFNLGKEDQTALQKFPANAEMRGIMLCAHREIKYTPDSEPFSPPLSASNSPPNLSSSSSSKPKEEKEKLTSKL